ncbi:hypothetical protein EXIGLDRAFT_651981, partial [Exidia glandulosa HHB12029]
MLSIPRFATLFLLPLLFFVQLTGGACIPKRAGVAPALSGNAVTFGAGTYPRATRLSNGNLLGAYTSTSNGENIINIVISTNNGASWQAQGVATRGVGDIDNPFPIQLSSGRVLVAFRNHSKDANGNYTFFRITVCFSDDLGKTWQFLSQPASDPAGPNGNWEPFMRLSNANVLQLYYSRENSKTDQDSLLRTSTDGGATWSTAAVISGGELSGNRDGMLGVATCGTGQPLVAIFETVPVGGQFSVWSVRSTDDGKTWGDRRQVYQPTGTNNNAGAPQIICVGGTTLVASFMTDEDTSAHQWPQQAAMKILTSNDGGITWGHKTTAFAVPGFWPGLLTLDSTSFLALADHNGAKAQKIVLN